MLEHENTYLAHSIPENLKSYNFAEISDFILDLDLNSLLRLRLIKYYNQKTKSFTYKYELTKKSVKNNNLSIRQEDDIVLNKPEYLNLLKLFKNNYNLKNNLTRYISKTRYFYNYQDQKFNKNIKNKNLIAEFNFFNSPLTGLVTIEFEFDNQKDQTSFNNIFNNKINLPKFCLANVSDNPDFTNKNLSSISNIKLKNLLNNYNYTPLYLVK